MRPCVAFLVGLLAAAAVCAQFSQSSQPPRPVRPETPARLMGAGSCAAAACHNDPSAVGVHGREYAAALSDPHDRAFRVLLEERSRRMLQRYRGVSTPVHPERDVLCLRCHVHPEIDRRTVNVVDGVRQFRHEDGVSCEACHGAAERWLDQHHRPEWRTLSADDKASRFGMTPTRPLTSRIAGCLPCHVGAPGMEVGHDLIAAGHPRLAFEFSGYHTLMHRHWRDSRDLDPAVGGDPRFQAHAWAYGNLLTLRASLDLLEHRLGAPVWPEFADFDCYACHHDLRNPGDRQNRDFPNRPAGRLTWNPWPAAKTAAALAALGKTDPELLAGLQRIDAAMTKIQPDRAALRRDIAQVRADIDRVMADEPAAVDDRAAVMELLRTDPRTWDDAAQMYAGLAAMEQTKIDQKRPVGDALPPLADLRRALLPNSRYRLDEIPPIVERLRKIQ